MYRVAGAMAQCVSMAARATAASMSIRASICAMIVQTEAQLRQLRFITGKLKLSSTPAPAAGGG